MEDSIRKKTPIKAQGTPAILPNKITYKGGGAGSQLAPTGQGVEESSPQRRVPRSSRSGEPWMCPCPRRIRALADFADTDLDGVGPK